jgi:hypothetical protein
MPFQFGLEAADLGCSLTGQGAARINTYDALRIIIQSLQ